MLCLCTIINKKPFSIMISTPRCGDQKKKTREGEKCSSSLLFEQTSSLSAGQSILNLSTALVTTSTPHKYETEVASPQYIIALALTTTNSSESDSCSVCASIRVEGNAGFPSPETRH